MNGICASCTSCDTYLTDAPLNANSARSYMFWQAEGAVSYYNLEILFENNLFLFSSFFLFFLQTFCVPDQCCNNESDLVEGGGCESGDCDENVIDPNFDATYGI